MEYFEKLFEPLQIGKHTFKNRLVMSPMHLGLADDGYIGDRLFEYYRARAEGGVGYIIVGWAATEEIPMKPHPGMSINSDDYIEGFTRMAKMMHENDVRFGVQIAPTYVLKQDIGEDWTEEHVDSMIQNSVDAAKRLLKADVDVIELMCMGGSLFSKFLSPVYNKRKGKYGGESFEERIRFPLAVISGIKKELGDDMVVAARIHGNEFLPGGYGNEGSRRIAREFVEAGASYISVTGGGHDTKVPQITMQVPSGTYVHLAAGVKQEVDVPVIAANRINNPVLAEEILVEGMADMIIMGRGLSADPDLPNKAREGRLDEINHCVACNQGCLDLVFQMKSIRCMVNGFAGVESEMEMLPTEKPKKIVVVGAGPGGMTAASLLAEKGHEVVLFEKELFVGGLLNYAAMPPGRDELFRFIDYSHNKCEMQGVDMRLGVEVSVDEILAEKPDEVIIATGAEPVRPPIPGLDHPMVVFAEDVLARRVIPGKNVVIIGGGATGVETADFVARLGSITAESARFLYEAGAYTAEEAMELSIRGPRKVSVIEMIPKFGANIGKSTRWTILKEIKNLGVNLMPERKCISVGDEGVTVEDPQQNRETIEADTIILAIGYRSRGELFENLQGKVDQLHIIGDAKQVRRACEAVWEATELAVKI
jgi:2,4-dienoyl-CoA reductase-like NADH-dependent reductase (Old Yellow Enzyme family)/NADPH-dependent glutamate synthase beta subunit-like oxidoreductase